MENAKELIHNFLNGKLKKPTSHGGKMMRRLDVAEARQMFLEVLKILERNPQNDIDRPNV